MSWLGLLAPLLVALASGCSQSSPPCTLDGEARARAGAGAVDCGHVAVKGDRTKADACVQTELAGSGAFFAEYDMQGTDSAVSLAVVRGGDGKVVLLSFDGDPSGGSGARAVINGEVCAMAIFAPAATAPSGYPVECATTTSLGQVCN